MTYTPERNPASGADEKLQVLLVHDAGARAMTKGNGKVVISVGGFGTSADREMAQRNLEPPLTELLGPVQLNWNGPTTNGKLTICSEAVPPEVMREFVDVVKKMVGSHCAINLSFAA